ncbi:hypothetical protein CQA57_05800 [Helicobacter anseris]|uniref:Toprim domain-containing protein n=1 Tax=Helicobacter anseris TaxID=375926 RepID=A0A3D8J6B8_9HELI|nr:hypothetical protein [Helicobacter anseris]RDU73039.1 hypothetical protein CQA57_05800 [Helicobacter anseris]
MEYQTLYQGAEASIALLQKYGFNFHKIGSRYFFALRDERTPSATINQNGSIHDFGSGFHGSVYDVLEISNKLPSGMSKGEALKFVREELFSLIGVDLKIYNFSETKNNANNSKKILDLEWFKKTFLSENLFKEEAYLRLLKKTITSTNDMEKIFETAKKFHIGYSKPFGNDEYDRLVMPILDFENNIVTLWKYNPFAPSEKKLLFLKGRNRGAFNTQALKETNEQIVLVCEGEKDVLNAYARNLVAVTPGGATSTFKEEVLPLFKDKRVLCIGDYDDAGMNFNFRNALLLRKYTKKVSVANWNCSVSKEMLFKGFDLSNYFEMKKGVA